MIRLEKVYSFNTNAIPLSMFEIRRNAINFLPNVLFKIILHEANDILTCSAILTVNRPLLTISTKSWTILICCSSLLWKVFHSYARLSHSLPSLNIDAAIRSILYKFLALFNWDKNIFKCLNSFRHTSFLFIIIYNSIYFNWI